jgi:predicted nucleic acid-binding protein
MPSDPDFHQVEIFFRNKSQPRYISEVSILELYCVFSRLMKGGFLTALDDERDFEQLATDEKVRVAVEHAVRSWGVKVIIAERTFVRLPVSKQMLDIAHELFEAIRCSVEFSLKTLDALHLAYAGTMKELVPDLDTFRTLDRDVCSRKEVIQNRTGIRILTPLDM